MLTKLFSHSFMRFCFAGAVGFLVDFTVLHLLIHLGWNPFSARCVSVAAAMFTTWQINRRFTFRQSQPCTLGEALRYASVNGFGLFMNYGSYSLCLLLFHWSPTVGLVVGSIAGMGFNYLGNLKFVFSRKGTST